MRAGRMWIRGALASTAAVALLSATVAAQGLNPASKPAAVVNGEAIPMSDVEGVLKDSPPAATPLTEAQRKQRQVWALGMLIDDLLMQQFLRKNGPTIDPGEIDKQLTELKAGLAKQNRTLADFLKETHQTEAELRANIQAMLQWAGYVKSKNVPESEIKRYYDEYKDFFDLVSVRASHIVLRLTPAATDGEKQAAMQKLQAIRQEILAGRLDFAAAAKQHSQCTSAANGGDLGYFPRKWKMDDRIAKVAFGLKPGEVSDVVMSEFGLHILKVTDRKAGTPSQFDKIKDEVRDCYVEDLRQYILGQERHKAKIDVNLP